VGLLTALAAILLVVVAAVAQPAVSGCLGAHGVFPDLAVASVVVASMFLGPFEAMMMGLVAGLVCATQVGHAGLAGVILSRAATGALAGVAAARLYHTNVLVQMLAVALGVAAADCILFLFLPGPDIGGWLGDLCGKTVISALCAPLLFGSVQKVAAWEAGGRDRHRRLR